MNWFIGVSLLFSIFCGYACSTKITRPLVYSHSVYLGTHLLSTYVRTTKFRNNMHSLGNHKGKWNLRSSNVGAIRGPISDCALGFFDRLPIVNVSSRDFGRTQSRLARLHSTPKIWSSDARRWPSAKIIYMLETLLRVFFYLHFQEIIFILLLLLKLLLLYTLNNCIKYYNWDRQKY